ncbi:hypothetical protein B0H16DRAFT_1475123 [Mycena metata]|uniref:Uncharacterized protein n=1 Tax=Mycena metata TaxID=1033252 RepID=A0AAD7HFH8_9AGAR|nr:hypothetical protein B0H16DRAFT_1475123 [Mycena metata]
MVNTKSLELKRKGFEKKFNMPRAINNKPLERRALATAYIRWGIYRGRTDAAIRKVSLYQTNSATEVIQANTTVRLELTGSIGIQIHRPELHAVICKRINTDNEPAVLQPSGVRERRWRDHDGKGKEAELGPVPYSWCFPMRMWIGGGWVGLQEDEASPASPLLYFGASLPPSTIRPLPCALPNTYRALLIPPLRLGILARTDDRACRSHCRAADEDGKDTAPVTTFRRVSDEMRSGGDAKRTTPPLLILHTPVPLPRSTLRLPPPSAFSDYARPVSPLPPLRLLQPTKSRRSGMWNTQRSRRRERILVWGSAVPRPASPAAAARRIRLAALDYCKSNRRAGGASTSTSTARPTRWTRSRAPRAPIYLTRASRRRFIHFHLRSHLHVPCRPTSTTIGASARFLLTPIARRKAKRTELRLRTQVPTIHRPPTIPSAPTPTSASRFPSPASHLPTVSHLPPPPPPPIAASTPLPRPHRPSSAVQRFDAPSPPCPPPISHLYHLPSTPIYHVLTIDTRAPDTKWEAGSGKCGDTPKRLPLLRIDEEARAGGNGEGGGAGGAAIDSRRLGGAGWERAGRAPAVDRAHGRQLRWAGSGEAMGTRRGRACASVCRRSGGDKEARGKERMGAESRDAERKGRRKSNWVRAALHLPPLRCPIDSAAEAECGVNTYYPAAHLPHPDRILHRPIAASTFYLHLQLDGAPDTKWEVRETHRNAKRSVFLLAPRPTIRGCATCTVPRPSSSSSRVRLTGTGGGMDRETGRRRGRKEMWVRRGKKGRAGEKKRKRGWAWALVGREHGKCRVPYDVGGGEGGRGTVGKGGKGSRGRVVGRKAEDETVRGECILFPYWPGATLRGCADCRPTNISESPASRIDSSRSIKTQRKCGDEGDGADMNAVRREAGLEWDSARPLRGCEIGQFSAQPRVLTTTGLLSSIIPWESEVYLNSKPSGIKIMQTCSAGRYNRPLPSGSRALDLYDWV